MDKQKRIEEYVQGSVSKAVFKYALPSIAAQLSVLLAAGLLMHRMRIKKA